MICTIKCKIVFNTKIIYDISTQCTETLCGAEKLERLVQTGDQLQSLIHDRLIYCISPAGCERVQSL